MTVISFLLLCSTLLLFAIKQHRIKGKSFVGLLLYCFRFLNTLSNGYVSLSQQLVISLHGQVIRIACSLFDSWFSLVFIILLRKKKKKDIGISKRNNGRVVKHIP